MNSELISVTSVKALGASSSRYAVDVAGKRRVVSAELIAEYGLRAGKVLTDTELTALDDAVRQLGVFDWAVRLLAVRAYGSGELRRRLTRDREISADDAAAAVERLQSLGVLDDYRYAIQRAHSYAQRSGMSRRRIAQELARRGLDRSIVDRVIAELKAEAAEGGTDDEAEAALAAAAKRVRAMSGLDPATRKRRLSAFLSRRGFGYSDISAALRKLSVESDDQE